MGRDMGAMITATKEFTWDMAHMLAEHEGLCANLHGHTYKMQVTVVHKLPNKLELDGPARGMIVDFKELKNIVKELITDPLDHAFMGWIDTPDPCEKKLIQTLGTYNKKMVLVDFRPSAENMALDFLARIDQRLRELSAAYTVAEVKIWETPTSFATAI